MKRTTDIINIGSIDQIPAIEAIRSIPRERKLKLVFEKSVQSKRKTVGQNLKDNLLGFQIGIDTVEPEIHIAKLITDQEIEGNQSFFEQCAKDYRQLGEELIFKLVDQLDLVLNRDFPLETFNSLKGEEQQSGEMGDWHYYLHGFHCAFKNVGTGQFIEVPLVFGLEFGDLDPYFFMDFIKSTPKYQPIPVDIFEDYADGARINEKMISLGKFEKINSNVAGRYGTVVTNRQKVEIKSYLELNKLYGEQKSQNKKQPFNFWRLIGLKK
ncbi:DUF6896 domain-containing protein [Pedobacter sp. UBA5917]|uniref:DUF6896 domain-containing protein n=1 Tax=Pedobacter sp. UBA5917 TaxID=1947061 RepID=UPI0025EBC815|nr:hypothetical protein [Pedobacter sp. UBA5917]